MNTWSTTVSDDIKAVLKEEAQLALQAASPAYTRELLATEVANRLSISSRTFINPASSTRKACFSALKACSNSCFRTASSMGELPAIVSNELYARVRLLVLGLLEKEMQALRAMMHAFDVGLAELVKFLDKIDNPK
ncbi:hypothetical protein DFQ26_009137 [Actinomortierella ambigua]|nr:hypothetical protein DFQ26_009137 [Actinomortierella ambigua]